MDKLIYIPFYSILKWKGSKNNYSNLNITYISIILNKVYISYQILKILLYSNTPLTITPFNVISL